MPPYPLTFNICLGGPALSGGEWALPLGWEDVFRWETCLSPAGHCDPLFPPLAMYNLIYSPVTLPSFCLPISLLHLEVGLSVTERVVGGEGRGSLKEQLGRDPQADIIPETSAPKAPHMSSSSLPLGEGNKPFPQFGCPFFSLRKHSLTPMSCLFQRNPVLQSEDESSLSSTTCWTSSVPPSFQDQGNYSHLLLIQNNFLKTRQSEIRLRRRFG